MEMQFKVIVAVLIGLASVTVGALFENKSWVKWLEIFRIICYAMVPAYLVYWQSAPDYLVQIGLGYAVLSIVWLFQALTSNKKQYSSVIQ